MVTDLVRSRHLVRHSLQLTPSVSSEPTSTRRQHNRQTWFDHGSVLHPSQNIFPTFTQSGDVEIDLISTDGRHRQRYVLHSLILGQNSTYFSQLLAQDFRRAIAAPCTDRPAGAVTAFDDDATFLPDPSTRKRWRLGLDVTVDAQRHVPMLVQRPLTPTLDSAPPPVSGNKPQNSNSIFARTVSDLSALSLAQQRPRVHFSANDPGTLRDYDNLFRIFYNSAPRLDSVDIAQCYAECKSLVCLAEAYQALEVVGPRIDHHMLHFGNRLFKQIAKYPPSYLKLAFSIRSKAIFAEALKHVVGQWPRARSQIEAALPSHVIDLIEDKAEILDEMKARVDGKIFRLTIQTNNGDPINPFISFIDWLAVSLFRQWFAVRTSLTDAAAQERSGHRDSAPAIARASRTRYNGVSNRRDSNQVQTVASQPTQSDRTYFLLSSTDYEAYLKHEELKHFLKTASDGLYSRENLKRLERKMDDLKSQARNVVGPLVRNELQLDLDRDLGNRAALGYLTCTKLKDNEYPWKE